MQISYTKIAQNRGSKRLWLEGKKLAEAGFTPGSRYDAVLRSTNPFTLLLVWDKEGSRKVSGRKRGDKVTPIIDIADPNLLKVDVGTRVCADIQVGSIVITIHHEAQNQTTREANLKQKLRDGAPLTGAAQCVGIGVSAKATHDTLNACGVGSTLEWVVDSEGKYLQIGMDNNPAFKGATIIEAAVEEVEPHLYTPVDYLSVSLPCTGHSIAGRTKNGIARGEQHASAATAVFGLVNAVRASNPSFIISENVKQARDSATYELLRAELCRLGYAVHEVLLDGSHAGTLEQRERYYLVAVSEGLAEGFDLEDLVRIPAVHATLGDVLDPGAEGWRSNQHLKEKAVRDKAAGKGFARQVYTADSPTINVIRREYMKMGSADPVIGRKDGMERPLTPVEHAAVKRVDPALIEGVSNTVAHEGLGQGVLPGHFEMLIRRIFEAVLQPLKLEAV